MILIKIERHVLEETFNKFVHEVPSSPRICVSTTYVTRRALDGLSYKNAQTSKLPTELNYPLYLDLT